MSLAYCFFDLRSEESKDRDEIPSIESDAIPLFRLIFPAKGSCYCIGRLDLSLRISHHLPDNKQVIFIIPR